MKSLTVWKTACAVCILCAATSIVSAQTFTTLANFNGSAGNSPNPGLVQGLDGNFYGTANAGGNTSCDPPNGCGTVFKVTPSGTLTAVYSFCTLVNCIDGSLPAAALVLGTDGNFYGTTQTGGANGQGTAFRITPQGTLTTLYSFCAQSKCADGSYPDAALVQATDGNFYGTTSGGGSTEVGTVFKLTTAGVLTTLHSFDWTDGSFPNSLVQSADGDLYGTAIEGGNSDDTCISLGGGCGTAFELTTQGKFILLDAFDFTNGARPVSPPIQASNGSFYGQTSNGGGVAFEGCSNGCGTIYGMTTTGALTTLYRFKGLQCADPSSVLTQATDGSLYGASGDIYKISPAGVFTIVYDDFTSSEGATGPMLQATNGTFYGTIAEELGINYGSVYSFNDGFGPFVTALPAARSVGQKVIILGNNLTGTTAVTFNGTSAVFAVKSATEITATVPTGATTGTVQVVTPSGTLSSNVPFRVNP